MHPMALAAAHLLVSFAAAECTRGMVSVPATAGGEGSAERCVCPAGSYDWSMGLIFCFPTSKLYGGGHAKIRPSTGDDVAFRFTYGSQFDLAQGFRKYVVDLPDDEHSEWAEGGPRASEYEACMREGLKEPLACKAKVAWTRPTASIADTDTDQDWRYESVPDPSASDNIPGLMRLQHPDIFTPRIVNPVCLPCPPCADCVREGTATIVSGWGLGPTHQAVYNGLLRGSRYEFKEVRNKPGSAAIGPVGNSTTSTWGQRRNTMMQMQFRARNTSAVTDSSTGCSYCPYDDRAIQEYAEKTFSTPELETAYMDSVLPIVAMITLSFWIGNELERFVDKLKGLATPMTAAMFILLVGARSASRYFEQQAAMTSLLAWTSGHNCSIQCPFSTNIAEAAIAPYPVPFHKTMFVCPSRVTCPAEELYFDDGQKLAKCDHLLTDGQDAWWCGNANNVSLPNSAAEICYDAANWTSTDGRTCSHFAHTVCNATYFKARSNATWSTDGIAMLFKRESDQDMTVLISDVGALNPLDACCACGGGGRQKEAIQRCSHVKIMPTDETEGGVEPTSELMRTTQLDLTQAGQEGPLCAGCRSQWIMQKDGTCARCTLQDAKGQVWALVGVLVISVVLNLREMRMQMRTEAVDRAIRNLRASEDSDHRLLFSNLGNAKHEQLVDIMMQQSAKALHDEEAWLRDKPVGDSVSPQARLAAIEELKTIVEKRASNVSSSVGDMLTTIAYIYRVHPKLPDSKGQHLVGRVLTVRNVIEVLTHSKAIASACVLLTCVLVVNVVTFHGRFMEWGLHPELAVLVTPCGILLVAEIAEHFSKIWESTYGRYIGPLTNRYHKTRQQMEKAASLMGGEGAAEVVVSAEDSLIDQIKIVTVALQLQLQLPFVLNFEFPQAFKDWLDALRFINLDLFGDFSATCLLQEYMPAFSMLYLKFTVYMLLPPVLIYGMYFNFNRTKKRIERDIQRQLAQQDSSLVNPPKHAVEALRVRLERSRRSVVIRISNRTTSFMELVQGTDLSGPEAELSSSPVGYSDEVFKSANSNSESDYSVCEPPGIEGGKYGRLEAAFGLFGAFAEDDDAASGDQQEAGAQKDGANKFTTFEIEERRQDDKLAGRERSDDKNQDDAPERWSEVPKSSSRAAAERLMRFAGRPTALPARYDDAAKAIKDGSWELRQAGSKDPITLPRVIPPKSEVIVACSSQSLLSGLRLWLTYEIIQPGNTGMNPHVRLEVKSMNAALRKHVSMHADMCTDTDAGQKNFYVQYDDTNIQDRHADLHFTIDAMQALDDTATEEHFARLNALERMMMQRQRVELENSQLQAFSRVTTILFLMYNILTNNVFGMFACFDMDFGDRYNRLDLELNCNSWEFTYVWQTAALVALLLYPIGIPLLFGVMLFLNRKVLARDPTDEMRLEEFANVVTMIDESASIKDISSMFYDMDADAGGTVTLSELRTGAVQLGLKVQRGGSTKHASKNLKDLEFQELSEARKRDAETMMGFPEEPPSLERMRVERTRIATKAKKLRVIKSCSDNIELAAQHCVMVASLGPPCSKCVATDSEFLKKAGVSIKQRPCLKWSEMTADEQLRAGKLGFDLHSWEMALEQEALAENGDVHFVQRKLAMLPNNNLYTDSWDEHVEAHGGKAAWFEHVIAQYHHHDMNKEEWSQTLDYKEKTPCGTFPVFCSKYLKLPGPSPDDGRLKLIVDIVGSEYKIVYNQAQDELESLQTLSRQQLIERAATHGVEDIDSIKTEETTSNDFAEGPTGSAFGYEHIWYHQFCPIQVRRADASDVTDTNELRSWWVQNHLERYRTEPVAILQNLSAQKERWNQIKNQRDRIAKFFGTNWTTATTGPEDVKQAVGHLVKTKDERAAKSDDDLMQIMEREATKKRTHAEEKAERHTKEAREVQRKANEKFLEYKQAADAVRDMLETKSEDMSNSDHAEAVEAMKAIEKLSRNADAEEESSDDLYNAQAQVCRAALAQISMKHAVEQKTVKNVEDATTTLQRADNAKHTSDIHRKIAEDATKKAKALTESLSVDKAILEPAKFWAKRWDSKHYWDIFEYTWEDLKKDDQSLLDGNQLCLSEAVKRVFEYNSGPVTDEDAKETWTALCKTMKDGRSAPEEQAELFRVATNRLAVLEQVSTEVENLIKYIQDQEQIIVDEIGRQSKAGKNRRQTELQRQAEELWKNCVSLDWTMLSERPEVIKLLEALGYSSETWGASFEFMPDTFAHKDWDSLDASLRSLLSATKIVQTPEPGSIASFSQLTWDALYHNSHDAQTARNQLVSKHETHVRIFFQSKKWEDLTSDQVAKASANALGYTDENSADWDDNVLTAHMLKRWDELSDEQRTAATQLCVPATVTTTAQLGEDAQQKAEDAQRLEQAQKAWFWIAFGGERPEQRAEREQFASQALSHRQMQLKLQEEQENLQEAQRMLRLLCTGETENYPKLLQSPDLASDEVLRAQWDKVKVKVEAAKGSKSLDHEEAHLQELDGYAGCIEDKVKREGTVDLFLLQPATVGTLWNMRNSVNMNKHNNLISLRALAAAVLRAVGLTPFSLHRIYRYWSELSTEERQAGIRLGYTQQTWDQQVETFAPVILRRIRVTGADGTSEMQDNPIWVWYTSGSFLPKRLLCGHGTRSLQQLLADVVWPFANAKAVIKELLTGDRQKFSFLVKSYTPGCFWWELVEYIRKFVLSGVLIFVAPGSLSQVFVGSLVSLGYVLLVARCMPYRDHNTNRTKLLAEAALSIIFLCTLAMRGDLAGEYISSADYADFMVWAMMVGNIFPAAVNLLTAVQSYLTALNRLQTSLNQGGSAQQQNDVKPKGLKKLASVYYRVTTNFDHLYKFAVQLTSAFEHLGNIVASGEGEQTLIANASAKIDQTVEEDDLQELANDVRSATRIEKQSSNDIADNQSAGPTGEGGDNQSTSQVTVAKTFGAEGISVFIQMGNTVVPKRFRDMDDTQLGYLSDLGYQKPGTLWEAQYPSKTASIPYELLNETQKAAAQALGFTTATSWKYYWIDKAHSNVVLKRQERREFLVRKTQKATLDSVVETCTELIFPGGVRLTEDALLEALVNAWKACDLSAIKQSLEQYSVSYSEAFQHHVEAGLQGSDASDFEWDELMADQKAAAKALGFSRATWNSGELPATLTDDDGKKHAWDDLQEAEIDAALELDYTKETWDQADSLTALHAAALRETMAWFAKRRQSGNIKQVKPAEGGQEALEFGLLQFARTAAEELGDSATHQRVNRVKDLSLPNEDEDEDMFRDCWLQVSLQHLAHRLMQQKQQWQCESRSSTDRLFTPSHSTAGEQDRSSSGIQTVDNEVTKAQGEREFMQIAEARVKKTLQDEIDGFTIVFDILRTKMCENAIALYDVLAASHVSTGTDDDALKQRITAASAAFEEKFILRATYEVTMRLVAALKRCAHDRMASNASQQSVIAQRWSDLSVVQRMHLKALGYEDDNPKAECDGTMWDDKILSTTAKKKLTDKDISSSVRDAAAALDLDGERWTDWQEEWSGKIISADQVRFQELDVDQQTAAKDLGYTARSWNDSNRTPPDAFLRPWGRDENAVTIAVEIGTSETNEKTVPLPEQISVLQIKSIEKVPIDHVQMDTTDQFKLDTTDQFSAEIVDAHGKVIELPDEQDGTPRRVHVKKINETELQKQIAQKTEERKDAEAKLNELLGEQPDVEPDAVLNNPVFEAQNGDIESGRVDAESEVYAEDVSEPEPKTEKDRAIAQQRDLLKDIDTTLEAKTKALAALKNGWSLPMSWEVTIVVQSQLASGRKEDQPLSSDERKAAGVLGYNQSRWSAWRLDGVPFDSMNSADQVELTRMGYDSNTWAHRNEDFIVDHADFITKESKKEIKKDTEDPVLEGLLQAKVSYEDLTSAAVFFAALNTLNLLSPEDAPDFRTPDTLKNSHNKDTRYRLIMDGWKPPPIEHRGAQWDDVQANERWKNAAAVLNITEDADWRRMCDNSSSTSIESFLDVKLLAKRQRPFRMQMHLAQIHQACMKLSIYKAQWMGDIDHVRWLSLSGEMMKHAKLLGFDKKSWNHRMHTVVTSQEWQKIRKPLRKGFRRKQYATDKDDRLYRESVQNAAQQLWSLSAEQMQTRWDLLAKQGTHEWISLLSESQADANSVGIDRKKWRFLTGHIRESAGTTATANLATYESLFNGMAKQTDGTELKGSLVFETLTNTISMRFTPFFRSSAQILLKRCRVSMENTCIVARKGVARARRSMRNSNEIEIRQTAKQERKRKSEAVALGKLFTDKWSNLSSQHRRGAEALGYVSDRVFIEHMCISLFAQIKAPAIHFDFNHQDIDEIELSDALKMSEGQTVIAQQIAEKAVAHCRTSSQQAFMEILSMVVAEDRAIELCEKAKEALVLATEARDRIQSEAVATGDETTEASPEVEDAVRRVQQLDLLYKEALAAKDTNQTAYEFRDSCLAWDNQQLPMYCDPEPQIVENSCLQDELSTPQNDTGTRPKTKKVLKSLTRTKSKDRKLKQSETATVAENIRDTPTQETVGATTLPDSDTEIETLWWDLCKDHPQSRLVPYSLPAEISKRTKSSLDSAGLHEWSIAESDNEFQFEVQQLLSPKPWARLTEATKHTLQAIFEISPEDWATLRSMYFASESARLVAARLAFTLQGDPNGFDAAVGQVTPEHFCRIVQHQEGLGWDMTRMPVLTEHDESSSNSTPELRSTTSVDASSSTELQIPCTQCNSGRPCSESSSCCTLCARAQMLYSTVVEYWNNCELDELERRAGRLAEVRLSTGRKPREQMLLVGLQRRRDGEVVQEIGFYEFILWMDTDEGWATRVLMHNAGSSGTLQ